MSLPTEKANLFGNLVVSGSTELDLPVGVNISTGNASTSDAIFLPNAGTNVVLCQMPSGACLIQLSIYTSSPDFGSPTDAVTVTNGNPVYLVGNNTAGQYAQIRITNNSGATLAPVELVLMPLVKYIEGVDLLSGDRGNAAQGMGSTHLTPDGSSGTGQFSLTEGN